MKNEEILGWNQVWGVQELMAKSELKSSLQPPVALPIAVIPTSARFHDKQLPVNFNKLWEQ